jgi:hypothetical protein
MVRIVLLFFLAICSGPTAAQGFSDPSVRSSMKAVDEQQEAMVGRTFTYMFGRSGCTYPSGVSFVATPSLLERKSYVAPAPVTFTVVSVFRRTPNSISDRFYEVRMQDGTAAYVDTFKLRAAPADSEYSLERECLFEISPEEVATRLARFEKDRTKRQKEFADAMEVEERAAAEQAAKPGARIGMTANEVIERTNWGKPLTVNRTVTANVVSEQWVYGGGEYLYFRNGRLTAIQNKSQIR